MKKKKTTREKLIAQIFWPEVDDVNELDKKFQELGWRDTTEAYYGLDFTPFMNVVEEVIAEIKATKIIDYTT